MGLKLPRGGGINPPPPAAPGQHGGAGGGADAQDRACEREAGQGARYDCGGHGCGFQPCTCAPAAPSALTPEAWAPPARASPPVTMVPSPPPAPPKASAPAANVRNDGVPAHFKAMPEERFPHERTADKRRMDNELLGREADADDPDAIRAVLLALLCNQSDQEKERMRMDALRHLIGQLERNEINVTLYLKAARIVLYQGWTRRKLKME
jgi:hypothetical protein